jgi:F-type H+-transporting ATPase subunit gamma
VPGSAQIRQLRRRIRSVRSTQKITRAYEMIAASRIIKAQRRVNEARPYAEQITEIIKGLATTNEARSHPLMSINEANRVAIVIITSDRGLAGAYNANVLKRAERIIADEERDGNEADLFVVGRKGTGYFRFRGRPAERTWSGFSDAPQYVDAESVAQTVMNAFTAGRYRRIRLVYTDFQSSFSQVPNSMVLLPVDVDEFEGGESIPPEFMFEPGPAEILDLLIPRYVEAKVFAAILESSASEWASRQRAMKSATDNAEEVVNSLTRVMNQARQDQVTTEISEIVGGAEALSSGR